MDDRVCVRTKCEHDASAPHVEDMGSLRERSLPHDHGQRARNDMSEGEEEDPEICRPAQTDLMDRAVLNCHEG